jgi:uncharacterized protein YciI
MFLIDVRYRVPLERVDQALADHVAFLQENYARGIFVLSGRKVPRSGGIILARNVGRVELDAILATDPFAQQGLATYEVTEFVASMTAPGLAALQEG